MERSEILEKLPDPRLLIGGERLESGAGVLRVEDPARGEIVTEVSMAGSAEVDAAVQAAHQALRAGEWPALDARDRGHLLTRLAGLLKEDADHLAGLETLDVGKTFAEARDRDVARAVEVLCYFGGQADKVEGRSVPVRGGILSRSLPRPAGVVVAILPWDSPLLTAVRILAPALAAGCTTILAASEQAPLAALALASLVEEAGFPPGAVNVLAGSIEKAARTLASHGGVDAVVFAGAAATAGELGLDAAMGRARVSLELGGGNANLVFADTADPAELAARVGRAAFHDLGQGRGAARRILVEKELQPTLAARLVEVANGLRVGDPFDRRSDLGALASAPQLESVLAGIAAARAAGATCIAGGSRAAVPDLEGGHFVRPTVFTGVAPDSPLLGDEIVGPLAVLIPFESAEEAVELANVGPRGGGAGIWTGDRARALELASQLQHGTVWINDYGRFDPAAPSSGAHGSGLPSGAAAIDFYSRPQSIWIASR
jgi:aldehyde dehydrogenase (NAD+)